MAPASAPSHLSPSWEDSVNLGRQNIHPQSRPHVGLLTSEVPSDDVGDDPSRPYPLCPWGCSSSNPGREGLSSGTRGPRALRKHDIPLAICKRVILPFTLPLIAPVSYSSDCIIHESTKGGVKNTYSKGAIWSVQGFEPLDDSFPVGARATVVSVPGIWWEWAWLVGGLERGPKGLKGSLRATESRGPRQFTVLYNEAEMGCALFSEPRTFEGTKWVHPLPWPNIVNVANFENNLVSRTDKVKQSVMLGKQTLCKVNPWRKQSLIKSTSSSQSLGTSGPLRKERGKAVEGLLKVLCPGMAPGNSRDRQVGCNQIIESTFILLTIQTI